MDREAILMDARYYIGTSGWNYETFIGTVYATTTPKRRYLETYAGFFDSVELNASFYRTFSEKTWRGWYNRTPAHFVYAVKAPRYITHIRRLNVGRESVDRLFSRAMILREKLGAVLFQLPPNLKYDPARFRAFLAMLPKGIRISIEARNRSWFVDEVFRELEERNVAWVISDTNGRYPVAEIFTANFGYIRLHGTQGLYRGAYGKAGLIKWVKLLRKWNRDTYVYFDNTDDGSAAMDALLLKEFLENGVE